MFKVIFSLLGFVVVAAIAYLLFWFCQLFSLFSILPHIPLSVMALVLTIIFGLNIITCTIGLSKSLFYAKDNQTIVTFPVSANQIYISKMIVYYVNEIKKTFTLLIPIFTAYGLISSLPIYYYLWMPILLCLIALIPVLIGGLLAIPCNYVIAFFKRFQIIKILILICLLAGLIALVVYLINLIPPDIDLISSWKAVSKWIRAVLAWVTDKLYLFYCVTLCLCGQYGNFKVTFFNKYTLPVVGAILGLIIVLTLLNYLISRPIYLKIISKSFEFEKKNLKHQKRNHGKNKLLSTSYYESKRLIRDTSVISNTLLTLILTPIVILLLNRIYAAINTALMGDYLVTAFNVLIIMLFACAHNINVSSIYSRDGDALLISKTKPVKGLMVMLPRLSYHFITTLLIIGISTICFMQTSVFSNLEGFYLFLGMLFMAYSHIIWSADIDFNKPQTQLFKTEGSTANNPNEVKSTILTFALSAFMLLFVVFGFSKAITNLWFKMFVLALLFFLLRLWLFIKKVNTLYREV